MEQKTCTNEGIKRNQEEESFQTVQQAEEISVRTSPVVRWVKDHKTQLIIAGVTFSSALAIATGLKNQDTLTEYLKPWQEKLKYGEPGSLKWIENMDDDTLRNAQNKASELLCTSSSNLTSSEQIFSRKPIQNISRELNSRAWNGEVPHGPGIHRENGLYLRNDE